MSIADGKKFSPSQIKAVVSGKGSHFFDRKTMAFFGDTMKSFATILGDDGVTVMYRKPSASVNVFGNIQRAGRDCFNAWAFLAGDLHRLDGDEEEAIYQKVKNE